MDFSNNILNKEETNMKIRIKGDYLSAGTTHGGNHKGRSSAQPKESGPIQELAGKWVRVDTKSLSPGRFIVIHPQTGSLVQVRFSDIDDVDFEGMTFREFMYMAKSKHKRPLRIAEMEFFHLKRILFKKGEFPYDPALLNRNKFSLAGRT